MSHIPRARRLRPPLLLWCQSAEPIRLTQPPHPPPDGLLDIGKRARRSRQAHGHITPQLCAARFLITTTQKQPVLQDLV